uniref:Uncharacterized protein n=1 Tax=Arundo donax TaxID=35708 RepID=A0A0A8Z051_ARUDO
MHACLNLMGRLPMLRFTRIF